MKRPEFLTARRLRRSAERFGDAAAGVAITGLLVAAGVFAAAPAGADGIYRCVGADGKTVFTSNPGACRNAKPHVLKARVQHVVEGEGSRPRRGACGLPAPRRVQKRATTASSRCGAASDRSRSSS